MSKLIKYMLVKCLCIVDKEIQHKSKFMIMHLLSMMGNKLKQLLKKLSPKIDHIKL